MVSGGLGIRVGRRVDFKFRSTVSVTLLLMSDVEED